MDKILGFLPDADTTIAGVLTDCTNLIPFDQGMKGSPSPATPLSVPALAAYCKGASVVTKLDDTRRLIAGTDTKLYELTGGAWVDVSTGSYTASGDFRWSFAQFGNDTIASNSVDTIQRSTGSAFSAIAGAPKAKIIFNVGTQVMALNTNDGTIKQNGWHCCATYDVTSWTTSITTLCASGQLVSSAGQITAGGKLGEYAIAYKEKAIHIGQFVGAPSVWDWIQVPGGEAGCIGQRAWCDLGEEGHFLVGLDSFYIFDGTRPTPIGYGETRQWFYDISSPQYRYKTECVYDRQNRCIWIFFPSVDSTVNNKALVYHIPSKKWGKVDMTPESTLNYVSAGVTIDGLASISSTIDGLASYSFDSQYWLSGGRSLAIFDSSHQLQSITGPSTSSTMTTGDVGDDDSYTLLNKIRLRFAPGYKPSVASVQTFTKSEDGGTPVLTCTSTMQDGKFDVLESARWHRGTFSFTGDHRVTGIAATLIAEGDS
jgi:hypothetical protein